MLNRILDLMSDEEGLEMVEWAITGALLMGVGAIVMRQIGAMVNLRLNDIYIRMLTLP